MKRLIIFLMLMQGTGMVSAQELYFPPNSGAEWAMISPEELGWCITEAEGLYDFLEEQSSKALIILKDGKIVIERYFGDFTVDSLWYWASAGKTLTAFTVGIAQREGFLNIEDHTSEYLGNGWTSCPTEEESRITVRDQLQMTSGLADEPDTFCTDPECLDCLTEPGKRWAYHNAPYTLLDEVIREATGRNLNVYINQKITQPAGISGLFLQLGFNNVFFSTARSMARFGLLILNRGVWNGIDILQDDAYFAEMVNSSQPINPAYGYLWWLNGKEKFMLPQSQFIFNGSIFPDAPNDMIAALGANGQIINIIPSQNLIVVRIGNSPDSSLIANLFVNKLWMFLNEIICVPSSNTEEKRHFPLRIYPNPTRGELIVDSELDNYSLTVGDISGRWLKTLTGLSMKTELNLGNYPKGMYIIEIVNKDGWKRREKIIIN